MAKLPWPPPVERLQEIRQDDDVVAVAPMTALARVHRAAGPHGSRWDQFRVAGPVASARFDPHPPTADGRPVDQPGFGVLYAGLTLRTCLAEAFQVARVVDRHSGAPWLAVFRPTRTLRLLDLAGTWPTRAGASQAIASGARDRARAWARAVFAACDDVDGLWYRSSMDAGDPAICLWERAADALPAAPAVHLPLDAPALALPIARACRPIGYRWI
ncbi:MAG TPA: RES family NAD+ phosphorylase [Mycobacteriales bacterium]|nr:RES family NAD+ phosphorylase [Mycobacteriales bacterium]